MAMQMKVEKRIAISWLSSIAENILFVVKIIRGLSIDPLLPEFFFFRSFLKHSLRWGS